MLPKEIAEILENHDPKELHIVFNKIEYEASNPTFDIQISAISYNDEDNLVRNWVIETLQYRTCNLSLDFATTIEIYDSHPLLWQFSDIQSSMYFSGSCSNPDKLLLELYRTHKSLVGNFLQFEEVMHRTGEFEVAMKSTSGLFAMGPKRLLEAYAACLENYNLKYTIIGDRVPTFWNGEQHVQENGAAKILFIDNSYIIADSFKFIAR